MAPRELPEDTAARLAAEAKAKADAARAAQIEMVRNSMVQAPIPVTALPANPPTLGQMSAADQAALLAKNQAEARAQAALAAQAAEDQQTHSMLLGSQDATSPSAAQMADAARAAGAAASSVTPGIGAAPGTTTPSGASADAARLEAAARASAEEKPKQAVKSAAEVISAPASKVQDVIDKLKVEEAKGGPGIWDIIEAAAAGWHGRVPLYTQKALEKAAEESKLQQIQQTAQLQAGIEADQQAEAYKRQRALLSEELASREKIAGVGQQGAIPGISPLAQGFLAGGK